MVKLAKEPHNAEKHITTIQAHNANALAAIDEYMPVAMPHQKEVLKKHKRTLLAHGKELEKHRKELQEHEKSMPNSKGKKSKAAKRVQKSIIASNITLSILTTISVVITLVAFI